VLSNDIAGTVIQLGPSVTRYKVGDRIWGESNFIDGNIDDQAGLQEYCVLTISDTAFIPNNLSFDEASTLPVNLGSSYIALFHEPNLGLEAPTTGVKPDYSSEALLVVGGGSQCGQFAVQLAKLIGIGMIIVIAAERNTPKLKAMGATHIIDRHASDADIEAQVRNLVGDDLIYAYDPISSPVGGPHSDTPSATLALSCLSKTKEGRLATLLPGGVDEEVAKTKEKGYRKVFVQGVSRMYPELMKGFWEQAPGWLAEGKIKPSDPIEVIQGLDAKEIDRILDGYRDEKQTAKPNVRL
jgi:NADPH:quinone reductase